jgi:predicted transcriptional regulator
VALTNFHIVNQEANTSRGIPVSSRAAESLLVDLLRKLNRNMEVVSKKLDKLIELQRPSMGPGLHSQANMPENLPMDVTTLLSLPDHLRKSALSLATLGEGTATDISKETGRVRAVESDYLNQLVSMGLIKKKRKGRDVYFYIES